MFEFGTGRCRGRTEVPACRQLRGLASLREKSTSRSITFLYIRFSDLAFSRCFKGLKKETINPRYGSPQKV
jgi:hypothetical protein